MEKVQQPSLIAGLLKPDKGTFRFLGEELTKSSSRRIRKHIQMIFRIQWILLTHAITCFPSVQQGLRYVEKCDKKAGTSRARGNFLCWFKGKLLQKPIHQLSGGECQRAAIARAIIGHPKAVNL